MRTDYSQPRRSPLWRHISLVVIVSLLMPMLPALSLAEGTSESSEGARPVEYFFKDVFPEEAGDSVQAVGELTDTPRLAKSAAYGVNIAATAKNQYRDFTFQVAEAGRYRVSFQGYLYKSAAIGQLQLNGATLGTYDFYDPGSLMGPTVELDTVELEAGSQTLRIKAIGLNANATPRSNFSMYANKLILTPVTLEMTATPSKRVLLPNETAQMLVSAAMSDGSAVTDTVYGFSSSDPQVATVSPDGLITAVSEGETVITATVQAGNRNVFRTATIYVTSGVPEPTTYYFKEVFSPEGSISMVGNAEDVPPIRKSSAYGANIAATAQNQFRDFTLTVDQPAYYLVSFQGYLYKSAAIGELSLDGERLGTYDFYDPGSLMGPTVKLKTVFLTAGVHMLRIKAIGLNPSAAPRSNFSMYVQALTLTPMPGDSTLELTAAPAKSLLLPDETTQIQAAAKMSDGTEIAERVFEYSSSQPQVASVSANGLITALSAGKTVITTTVRAGGKTEVRTSTIQVTALQLKQVEVTLQPSGLFMGDKATVSLDGILSDGSAADLSHPAAVYSSVDETVADVDQNGVATGLKPGSTVIHAAVTFNGETVEGSLDVVVSIKPLASVELAPAASDFRVSQYAKASVNGTNQDGTPADINYAEVTYSSDNPSVVAIDMHTGYYNGLAEGEAVLTVTVKQGNVTRTADMTVVVNPLTSDKTRSTIYTPQKLANARHNIERYDWARNLRDTAVATAESYAAMSYDFLWNLVPPQSLPRSYGVNQALGSPVSGKEIDKYGNYPYLADPVNEPWKLIDPSAKDDSGKNYRFPTNDFGAYYESGLDERGIFRQELANKRLLVNTLYPEKGPTWGVDDGNGWVDENGNRYTFIAYYTHWYLWYSTGLIHKAINALRDAYIFTGDVRYARSGIVLLDRIADVYPELDAFAYDPAIYLQSAQGTGGGKAVGSIWETTLVKDFISAYDAFYPAMDDAEVLAFLSQKGEQYKLSYKTSGTGLRRNVESGIVRQVYPGIQTARIRGNVGMHQSALAVAAVVLDTLPDTKTWLDFNNQAGGLVTNPYRVTGGNLLASLVNAVDRDGQPDEAAPGYNRLWLGNFLLVADVLYGYDKVAAADLYENVKFRSMFSAMLPLLLSENYMPSIGDSDITGNPSLTGLDKMQLIRAFEVYEEPLFAQAVHFLNNNSTTGLHGDIFSAEPGQVAQKIEAAIETMGPLELGSTNLTGYGFTGLRSGMNDKSQYGISYLFPQLHVTGASTSYKTFEASGTVQLEASAPGQTIGFSFAVDRDDRYHVMLKPFRTSSYGIYNVYLDGQWVKKIDFFGSSKDLELLAELPLTAGTHVISFENEGKNPLASLYKMGVTELRLLTALEYDKVMEQRNTLRDTWLYYGRNTGHGHRDTLNLGMHAFGLDLAPDLGYPEFADNNDMHRHQWVNNTVSHNTVVVDAKKQGNQIVGLPLHYDDSDYVKLVDVEAPRVYPQTEMYRRTTAVIQVDNENSYSVDWFRVKGGFDHTFSFHSADGTVVTEGLTLTQQPTGTYAGPNVELGQRIDDVAGAAYAGSGYHWLKDVERDADPGELFSIDWNVKDTWNVYGNGAGALTDVHLRLTMLGPVDDIALANGLPPRNKPGNPPSLRYLLAHRAGTNLESNFVSVIEPYKGQRFVKSISPAVVKANGVPVTNELEVKAVKVELTNGRTDYIVSAMNPEVTYTIDDRIEFRGFFGMYAEKDGRQVYGYVNDGSYIAPIGAAPDASPGRLEGTVTDFTKTLSLANHIDVRMDLSGIRMEDLIGKWVYIANDGIRNASYEIKGISPLGGSDYRLDIGDMTSIRSYANSGNLSLGFIYDFAEGASFVIPLPSEAFLLHTEASVTGEVYNGWYKGEATVQLSVYGGLSTSATTTTYSLDGGQSWSLYTDPIVFRESGEHTLSFRSTDVEGRTEPVRSIAVKVDNNPPATVPVVTGVKGNGDWYVSDVQIALNAADSPAGIESTHYGWSVTQSVYGQDGMQSEETVRYAAPIAAGEGRYKLRYHSVDRAGNAEPEQTREIGVDKTAPAFTLLAGGEALLNGAFLEDSRQVVLTLQATDGLSGVASQGMTVDGQAYREGMPLNWAGLLGTHTIGIWVEDHAGNRIQETVTVIVTTSPASVMQLIDAYEAAGELGHAIASQLRNKMMQAGHHRDAGRTTQALNSLDDFMKHMNNTAHQNQISAQARAALTADIGSLRQMW